MKGIRKDRVDLQVSVLTFCIVVVSCLVIYGINYYLSYQDMIQSLQERSQGIYAYLQDELRQEDFSALSGRDDMEKAEYQETKKILENIRKASGVRYLYTVKPAGDGRYLYLVDGLPESSDDFRYPGDVLEDEVKPDIERAAAGEVVLPEKIKETSWGYIFVSYFPVYEGDQIVGAVGIEFDAAHQYRTYRLLKLATPAVIILVCLAASLISVRLFRRISNPAFRDLANTDRLTGTANRNAFDVMMTNLESSSKLTQMSLISIDFDGLKKINDTLGHPEGDAYLRSGVSQIQACIQPPDILYRVGGDEFALLLENKTKAECDELMEAISRQVNEYNQTAAVPVRFSMGYARYEPEQDASLYDTFKRADQAMYSVKEARRGRSI